jgi:peptidoglycan/LPS O-acetylase OafA/YrhL
MKPKAIVRTPLFSAGLWGSYWALEAMGLDSTHALVLVLIGVLAWFALYLIWGLWPPQEPRWKMYARIVAVVCVTLGVSALSIRASDLANWIALGGSLVFIGVGTAWANRPIRHSG